jgi:anti-sigma factor RsiW
MIDLSEKLSAYLDDALDRDETARIAAVLERDADARATLEALMQADALASREFAAMLDAPVPFALAQQIKDADLSPPARRPVWGAIAAGLVMLAVGGFGGYALKDAPAPVQQAGWLADIADYHAVYATQGRHLVEVAADEADHIETWLGNTVGATFAIPDLTQHGLTFEGGRLVVTNGKPVAQLMYRLSDGTVVALCLQQSNKDPAAAPVFQARTINGFDFVSWSADGADYVVIGPQGLPDLAAMAQTAAALI